MLTNKGNVSMGRQKKFCISGPIIEEKSYFLPERLNWQEFTTYIESQYYFVIHAPPYSGKTTAVRELAEHLNSDGKYVALYVNAEPAQAAQDDIEAALIEIVHQIADTLSEFPEYSTIASALRDMTKQEKHGSLTFLGNALRFASQSIDKPVVLFLDEFGCLIGDSRLSVLRQIRSGFIDRPDHFPQSLCLISSRDVRDYKIWSKDENAYIATPPFNIKAFSLRLPDFTLGDIETLYSQHTEATGQEFTEEAIEHVFFLTRGQPWLVNALAEEACFTLMLDRTQPITKELIEHAKDSLILRRETTIPSLSTMLEDPGVSQIMDAILSGERITQTFTSDDIQYCQNYGLLSDTAPILEIANTIYQQIIPDILASTLQQCIVPERNPVTADGALSMTQLIEDFVEFYREVSLAWLDNIQYRESGPYIIMLAYLQRIVKGHGKIHREYALGRGSIDLFVTWKEQKFVLELKTMHGESTLAEGLEQVAGYMRKTDSEGHLIIFDRDTTKSWNEKISEEVVGFESQTIHVWTL